ncbi:MAG: AAA-associated domain-containing protein [Candidatus Parvarchaeota archaeon]|nr:AAA-associated domain-containing protein [Candidatus Parvarchaeota archaeon]MCW1294559.1 AAA-associated domain-containing protein [Candidatus Parvarchaeum tengchongense]MCW1295234.1 AAA-associated domain-containing protein [Candidatus Parvarchaeum tengchongense]MCW1299144.1 AAA-associated domain-containing protein [Candidatus Parvarchaeum tengchongense]MCW1312484.1 AAA-associated domain-containing protein [Candidatus Parvarchaeum tengchongense]
MKGLFPLNIKIGQIQGVISILKEYNGEISLQKLSDEALEQADDLVNILQACKLLGFIKINKGKIKLNKKLEEKNFHEINAEIKKNLLKMEPFIEITKAIRKNNNITTTELFQDLIRKGVITYRDNLSGIEAFKRDLLVIGIRLEILTYDHENDIWKIPSKKGSLGKD